MAKSLNEGKMKFQLNGKTEADRITKRLQQRIQPGRIAVIHHQDLDVLAAEGLLKARVKAVVNAGETMTGTIPSHGVLLLLDAGIPVFEIAPEDFHWFSNRPEICIKDSGIFLNSHHWIPCKRFTRQHWLERYQMAQSDELQQLKRFIENTLDYAMTEKEWLLNPLSCEGLRTLFAGRHVLIAIRGREYREDLTELKSYIKHVKPLLIGVDGGADAFLEEGYKPDLIIGDMDSVSDQALRCGAELIVHSYLNGTAPGLIRLQRMGLPCTVVIPAGGTSEDLALMLAYEQNCEQIVTVGLHSHMQDFMEKGRQGMGSSWLVRMKVGSKLIDARGISRLYPKRKAKTTFEWGKWWVSYVRSLL